MIPIRAKLQQLRNAGIIAIIAAVTTVSAPASASEPPFPNKLIKIAAQGQPVADTIRDIFGQAGIQVKVSTAVKGNAAGKWVGTPKEIWTQISRAYNLVAYYDGGSARIYHANEITSRNFQTSSPESVLANARKLGILGGGNSIKAGQNTVIASGVPEFLNRVAQLAAAAKPAAIRVATTALPPVDSVPVSTQQSTGDIVSPMNKNPKMIPQVQQATLPALQPTIASSGIGNYQVAYQTMQTASARSPYEIRIYKLKYARAQDRYVNNGDQEELVDGVATMLRNVTGNGGRGGQITLVDNNPNNNSGQNSPPYGNYPYLPGQQIPNQSAVTAQPQINDGNGVRIYAYGNDNSIYIRDLPSKMSEYHALIKEADTPKTQLEIEITIIDVDVERSRELGIDWSFGFSALGNIFGGVVASTNSTTSTPNINASFVNSPTSFVKASITAYQRNGVFKIHKTHSMPARDNERSTSDNRQTIPIRINGSQFGGATIEEYRVGSLLKIKPSVTKEAYGFITSLEVDVRDGSISGQQSDGTPFFNESRITTIADVPQGESFILGGLTIDTEFDERSQVPIVGDIPVLGNAFKKRKKGGSRRERIVIITPRILSNAPGVINGRALAPQQIQPIPIDPKTGRPIIKAPNAK